MEIKTVDRKWAKVRMVAVPTFLLLMFLAYARQFTEPDVSFIPKNAVVDRTLMSVTHGRMTVREVLSEETVATWQTDNGIQKHKQYVEEIKAKGYWETPGYNEHPEITTFINSKGDRIQIDMLFAENSNWGEEDITGFRLQFSHNETRPMQRAIKRALYWMRLPRH